MTHQRFDNIESAWARLGVLFNVPASEQSPDLELLLLDSARKCGANTRIFPLVVSWLSLYGSFVARHRLRRLIVQNLEVEFQCVLGLIIESAIANGAPESLRIVTRECRPAKDPKPLSKSFQDNKGLRDLARRTASEESQKWGVWTSRVVLKPDAIRPVSWLLQNNPDYAARRVRRGDLRSSILEILRNDTPNFSVRSESELVRLCGSTRKGLKAALNALIQEGMIDTVESGHDRRMNGVRLSSAA